MDALTFQTRAMQLEKLLYHISWSMLKDPDDCADAVQEALARAWQKRGTLKDPQLFKPWLTRILVNQCRDMLRRKKRFSFFPLEEVESIPQETNGDLLEAVGELKPQLRLVIVLHYLEGMTVQEISSATGVPTGTVKTRLKQGRQQLGVALEAEGREALV